MWPSLATVEGPKIYAKMPSCVHTKPGFYATVSKRVITFFDNHRRWMQYDVYLAAGLPVGTGVVESACGSVVKHRMEGEGKPLEPGRGRGHSGVALAQKEP